MLLLADGRLELFYPVEEAPQFGKLLSSLSETAQDKITLWKSRGGGYLAVCTDVRWEIYRDANIRTFDLLFREIGRELFAEVGEIKEELG